MGLVWGERLGRGGGGGGLQNTAQGLMVNNSTCMAGKLRYLQDMYVYPKNLR